MFKYYNTWIISLIILIQLTLTGYAIYLREMAEIFNVFIFMSITLQLIYLSRLLWFIANNRSLKDEFNTFIYKNLLLNYYRGYGILSCIIIAVFILEYSVLSEYLTSSRG